MNMIPSLFLHLSTIQSAILDECNRGLRDTDLHGVQLFYLMTVCRNAGVSQDRLAALLGVANSNVTRQLAALEKLGYVTRRRAENDGRCYLVSPTDRAYELLPRLVEVLRDAQIALVREMSSEEQELLLELVERMSYNAARSQASHRRDEE